MSKIKKGLFIVFDGTDGSGKATQTELLIRKLKEKGRKVEKIDFPQYGKKSAALVEEYLNGKYGAAEAVGPYRASIFYACDRFAASARIKKWLSEGKVVISNRYVTANMGHQGGKIRSGKERKKFFKWLYGLEYNIFSIPKPDLNIILHVDAAAAQKMIDFKKKRGYLKKGKRDIHENDLKHLQDAEKVYVEIAKAFPDFFLVDCMKKGKIMSKGEISDLIWDKLKKILSS
jgi:dTMP kinase